MQDPEIFLAELGLSVNCAVDSGRPAIITAAHRVSIGYESIFISDSAAMREFQADLTTYCGVLTDPVTLARFRPDQNSPRSPYLDRVYLFASDSSKLAFDMMPDNYAWPQHHMIPMDSAKTEMKPM